VNSDETASVKKITKTWIIIYEKLPNTEEKQDNIIQKIGTYSYTIYIFFSLCFPAFHGASIGWNAKKIAEF
jgi:hypothetical protein